MHFLNEDYDLIEMALETWRDNLNDELQTTALNGRAAEIIDEQIERTERLILRLKSLKEK